MRITPFLITALTAGSLAPAQELPARHEVGLSLGGLFSKQRTANATRLELGPGIAFQTNYGYRLTSGEKAALYGEVHFLASPLREVSSTNGNLTRDAATIFLTPGLRVRFLNSRPVSPWVAAGAGWAVYEQSTSTVSGAANPASRVVNHAALNYGAGADVRFWRFIGLRAEIRDFYAGGPSYNTTAIRGGQHNVVAGAGLVLRFR